MQSPSWEANWFAGSQEIPRISRNPKVHYRTHKRPPTVSILGQPNPIHIPTSHLLQIHPNIIHPSTPRSPQWSPSLRFPHQDPIHPLSSPIRATCPAHLIPLEFTVWKMYADPKSYISFKIMFHDYSYYGISLLMIIVSTFSTYCVVQLRTIGQIFQGPPGYLPAYPPIHAPISPTSYLTSYLTSRSRCTARSRTHKHTHTYNPST